MTCSNKCTHGVMITISIIGGKWKPIILTLLLENKTLRNGEFLRLIPEISQKVLTQQLRELEKDDIVNRKVYDVLPSKVEYSLTSKGKSLDKVLYELGQWGENIK